MKHVCEYYILYFLTFPPKYGGGAGGLLLKPCPLKYGMPQGWALFPILLNGSMKLLDEVIRGLQYADDMQLDH